MTAEENIERAAYAVLCGDGDEALRALGTAMNIMEKMDDDEVSGLAPAIERIQRLAEAAQAGLDEARASVRSISEQAGSLRYYSATGSPEKKSVGRGKYKKF